MSAMTPRLKALCSILALASAWYFLDAYGIQVGFLKHPWEVLQAAATIGMFLLPVAVLWAVVSLISASRRKCPNCKAANSIHWLHRTKSGHADSRYKINYEECVNCTWVSPWEEERRKAMRSLFQRMEDNLAEARAEAEMSEGETFGRTFVWLLKYIALADRQYTQGERIKIKAVIKRLFPPERAERLEAYAESLRPEFRELSSKLAFLKSASPADQEDVLRALVEIASADGSKTPAEEARLDQIRAGLLPE